MAQPTPSSTTGLSSGSSTALGLVERIALRLGDNPFTDVNTNNLTDSGTSATVATGAADRFEAGGTIDWMDDGTFDAALVTVVADTALTIRRGHRGSTAAAHDGSATAKVFRLNPDFLSHDINQSVTEAVNGLWPDLFNVYVSDFTVASSDTDTWYALPADTEEVLSVYQLTGGTPEDVRFAASRSPSRWFHSGFAASTKAFQVTGLDSTITPMYVITTQQASVTTLTTAMQDIVMREAAANLLEAQAMGKARQGDPFTFDATSKIQLWRREANTLRSRERRRLEKFLPARHGIQWIAGTDFVSWSSAQINP